MKYSVSGEMSEQAQIQKVFKDIHEHQRVAELIQRFSTNKGNVQKIALEGLELGDCRQILDLGCAFGSFTEKLKGRVAADATATGVDIRLRASIHPGKVLFNRIAPPQNLSGEFL
jgi:ubiquinone/menaquinone biosynthesis C-methylase UbiE